MSYLLKQASSFSSAGPYWSWIRFFVYRPICLYSSLKITLSLSLFIAVSTTNMTFCFCCFPGIDLQYSTDLGKTWATVIPPCYPGSPSCTHLYPGSIYLSDIYSTESGTVKSNRIVVPLPSKKWTIFHIVCSVQLFSF